MSVKAYNFCMSFFLYLQYLILSALDLCTGEKKEKKEEEAKVRYFDILYTDTQTTLKDIKICRHQ